MRATRGLKWENKMYKLKRSIAMSVRANFVDIYLQGMHDRSMQSVLSIGTVAEHSKLVFVVSTEPVLAQVISLFTTGKNSLSIVPNYTSIQVFTLR